MPRVIYNTATTLNGFLADDQDSLSWLFVVPGADEAESGFSGFLKGIRALVMGSTTYGRKCVGKIPVSPRMCQVAIPKILWACALSTSARACTAFTALTHRGQSATRSQRDVFAFTTKTCSTSIRAFLSAHV